MDAPKFVGRSEIYTHVNNITRGVTVHVRQLRNTPRFHHQQVWAGTKKNDMYGRDMVSCGRWLVFGKVWIDALLTAKREFYWILYAIDIWERCDVYILWHSNQCLSRVQIKFLKLGKIDGGWKTFKRTFCLEMLEGLIFKLWYEVI